VLQLYGMLTSKWSLFDRFGARREAGRCTIMPVVNTKACVGRNAFEK